MDPSVLLLAATAGLLVLLMTSRRRQQREQQQLQSRLAPGSEVMTGGGLYATVISLEDTVVVLETGPGQRSRWDRRAVARVLSTPDDGDDTLHESPSAGSAGAEDGVGADADAGEGVGNATPAGGDTGGSKES